MAKFTLKSFEPTPFELDITSEINLTNDDLYIGYKINQGLTYVDLGPYRPQKERVLNLWEKTCFEFFLSVPTGHYLEFNFSPNFAWNIFYFEQLRGPLKELQISQNLSIDILNSNDKFSLIAKFPLANLPTFMKDQLAQAQFGITSVIKDKNADKSYWALTHKDNRPNFHMYESFIGKF